MGESKNPTKVADNPISSKIVEDIGLFTDQSPNCTLIFGEQTVTMIDDGRGPAWKRISGS